MHLKPASLGSPGLQPIASPQRLSLRQDRSPALRLPRARAALASPPSRPGSPIHVAIYARHVLGLEPFAAPMRRAMRTTRASLSCRLE